MPAKPSKPAAEKPVTADSERICTICNLTAARVGQLCKDGVIVKTGRNSYDLWKSVRGYIEYLQKRRTNQHDGPASSPQYEAEKIRKTTEEADKLALANARSRGELVDVQAVKRLGERVMVAIRSRILQFPLDDDMKDTLLSELMDLKKMDWSREG